MIVMYSAILEITFVLIITVLRYSSVNSYDLYGPHPRIITVDGNLILYAAEYKNISLRTTRKGYVNVNDENLITITKDARRASEIVKTFKSNVLTPFITTVNRMSDIIEGNDGLLTRVQLLENSTVSVGSGILMPTNRRVFAGLNRRVNILERKVTRILELLNKNECGSNPCRNGGECQDLFNGYLCNCPDGWEGPLCDKDVNECMKFFGTDLGCQNGAICNNKPGSYECLCASGWIGIHCTRRSNSCDSSSNKELCGHGICVPQNTPTGYKCICDQGWTSDPHGACTADVDECKSAKHQCSVNPFVPCINIPGSFYCGHCPVGYSGNGYSCTDIDECLNANGGCSVNPTVPCINIPGSRICGPCPPGYYGDGVNCNYRGVCQINNGGCHFMAKCTENSNIGNNYVQCVCPNGYSGNGIGPNGCIANSIDSYFNPCINNPCQHGICTSNANATYYCTCSAGYTGKNCDTQINYCNSNPCLNSGKCSPTLTGYICECTASFTGDNCDIERQVCGGKLIGETGYLAYPSNNNTNYQSSVSCSWVIQTEPNQVLSITFSKFNIEKTANCLYDWLQIHDGPNSAAHNIGRFCGTDLPNGGKIISTHNSVYIWFRSDHTVAKEGFALRWTTMKPECTSIIAVESHGTIKSPGSPGNYPPNRDCIWYLLAPLNKRIQIHFFTLMIGNNPNCSYDYLEIYTGVHTVDEPMVKYCNSSHPEPFITNGPAAAIHFHSDASGSHEGFQLAYSVIEGVPGCGGTYTYISGEISSPTFEQQYPSLMNCEYKIQLEKHLRIKLTFLSFSLEDSLNCEFDSLKIYEGNNDDAPLAGKYCGSSLPPVYTSLTNVLYIVFKTDLMTNDDGFRLKYQAVCNEIFDEPSGIIESAGRGSYNNYCLYEIKRPPGDAIALSFTGFSGDQICRHSYLEIHDGDNENSTLIGKYCPDNDNTSQTEVLSTHNYLWMKLYFSPYMLRKPVLKANYTSINIRCGGIMKEKLGIINSPEHPSSYPPDTKCTWLLSAPSGYVIQLTWISFHLEQGNICSMDYVAVYDNNTDNGNGQLIGKYCGRKLPPTIVSSSNLITIIFVSDASLTYDGFIINYNFINEKKACGGTYFTNTGVIRTPNYPDNYLANRDCIWVITVRRGQQMLLNVTDFELESYNKCNSDYLEIRNGAQETSPLIGRFCGKDIPRLIPTHTNSVYLKFHTDSSHNYKGFKIIWDGTIQGCGGTLNSPTGHITSPNYPQPYGESAECQWKIITNAGSYLQIMFTDLEMENHERCKLDYVEIFDDLNVHSKSFGKLCTASDIKLIQTSNNRALVKFRSDVSRSGRGFQLRYVTICNNEVKGFRGAIESLNFPNNYPENEDCTWTIKVPRGNKINITFSYFDVEQSASYYKSNICKFDYIEIKEGSDDVETYDEVLLPKYCAPTLPLPIVSNKNIVQVHFISDNFKQRTGFRMEWVANGCGGLLKHPVGTIETPGYPNRYPVNTICEWSIEVDYESSIELSVDNINFEKSNDCLYDALQIYNGPNENSPMLTNLCHTSNKVVTITSTGNSMFVKFVSDFTYTGRGFHASYKTVPIQCGGKYTTSMGTIQSRNYPKNYNNRDDCTWFIEVDELHRVQLSFHDFDVASSKNCSEDNVQIYDGDSESAPLIATLCGTDVRSNETFTSTTNKMLITMKTNEYVTAKGFLANYTIMCGSRLITNNTGLISFQSTNTWECSWVIKSGITGRHVSLTITFMSLNANCDEPPLQIYDGEDKQSPLIGNYCGTKVPPTIVSKGDVLFMDLSSAYDANFIATYSILETDCGNELTSLSGMFASPGYPNNYPMNLQCEWIIRLAPGNKVLLTFTSFDLISSDNCNLDYVEVRQESSSGNLLGTFCGNEIPTNITESNNLWIQFRSSDTGTAKGFLAEYSLVHGNELFGKKGMIGSPLYPLVYRNGENFGWRVTVDYNALILITFKDFYIEWSTNEECYTHGLTIYDGFSESSPELIKLCSLELPKPVRSSTNIVYIKFVGTYYHNDFKFLLEWVQVEQSYTIKELGKKILIDGCGSETAISLTDLRNYKIQSPGFPGGYHGNLNCEWIFTTEPGDHLSIIFNQLDLEGNSPKCVMDYVSIYSNEQDENGWKLIEKVCLSNSTYSSIDASNMMKVVFHTDSYVNKTGFSAEIFVECGGTLTAPNGIIQLSNATRVKYSRYAICEWNIQVKTGRKIQIKFLNINIDNKNDRACENYVLLKNGKYPDSPLLGKGKYCDNNIPEVNETSGNYLYIKYKNNISNSKGFKLSYKEVSHACGGTLQLNREYPSINISSPNYPNIPPPHIECIWIVTAPPGETIQMDFIERFDIGFSSNCYLSGVELRDGGTSMSELINIFCETIPGSQKTIDNLLYVRYYTNNNEPNNGFKATLSIATCGGVIRGVTGKILSPYYPTQQKYQANTICTWHIIGPIQHYLNLNFNGFHFPYASNCSRSSHLLIKQKLLYGNETILGTFCGTKLPNPIQTSSNEAIIEMRIGSSPRPVKGFSISFNSSLEKCGGNIEASSGFITSPGYPNDISIFRDCEWIITVPKYRRVSVKILDFGRDLSAIRHNQGISFFNGKSFHSAISYVDSYYNNKQKEIKSSSNIMTVYYWNIGTSNGLKLSFSSNEPTICLGDFSEESGIITNPSTNDSTYYCEWDRHSKSVAIANRSLVLIVDAPIIGKSTRPYCKYSTSSISVLADNDLFSIAELCGVLTAPKIIRSPYLNVKLQVNQANFHDKFNYNIKYKEEPCGGLLYSSFGTIISPGYPNHYANTIDCAWLIQSSSDASIQANFTTINLDPLCDNDYVIVYNGMLPSSPKLGKFCGSVSPFSLQSESNAMWIEYHASGNGTGKGFSLTYNSVDLGCGGTFHDHNRMIQTPNYPISYPNNTECLWEVRADNGYHIGLKFINRFYLEDSKNCTNDFVEIFDYKDDQWISMGRKCGRIVPQIFNSTANRMRILFRSNSKITANGFQATWQFNCGGTFFATNTRKYITSPGYPYAYFPNLYCKYIIKAPKSFVNIIFNDFQLEEGPRNCKYDNVSLSRQRISSPRWFLHNPSFDALTTIGIFCGTNKPPPVRQRDEITVTFRTDKWIDRKGFALEYFIDQCGGIVTEETMISSPVALTGSGNYYGSINCVWNVTAPEDKVIVVKFSFFELEHHKKCYYDFVDLYNGKELNEKERLAVLCGNITQHLPVIRSSGNTMIIRMRTDMSNHFKGFSASVMFTYGEKVGCGGMINLTNDQPTKTIQSPIINHSQQYSPNLDCHWLILVPMDNIIELEFESFHMDACANVSESRACTCDYLQVRDGGGSLSEFITQLCGHNLPKKITSTGNQLWLRMVTDNVLSSTGFRAVVRKIPSFCGSSLLLVNETKHLLTSPNYPEFYPNNIRCTWTLRTFKSTIFNKIEIHFEDFQLEDSNQNDICNADRIEIIDKNTINVNENSLGENFVYTGSKTSKMMYIGMFSPWTRHVYCGSNIPTDYHSASNELTIKFISDDVNRNKGFKIDYRITGCNRNYTSTSGRILNEAMQKECIFKITAPLNHTISIYIQHFFLSDFQNCKQSYLEVHDGNSSEAREMGRLCGFQIPNPLFSNSNELWFKARSIRKGLGSYDLLYTATDKGRGCGGTISGLSGKFTSPLYPSSYRNASVCRWDISVPRGLILGLKFITFNLGPSYTCDTDYVQLIDVNDKTAIGVIRTKYCGGDNPAEFVSTRNKIALLYYTSVNNGGSGWTAYFYSKDQILN